MSHKTDKLTSYRISLFAALGFALAMLLLFLLELTHSPDPLVAGHNARIAKVGSCVLLAAMASVICLVYAILPVCRGDLRVLAWLIPLGIGWLLFVTMYDWTSLLAAFG